MRKRGERLKEGQSERHFLESTTPRKKPRKSLQWKRAQVKCSDVNEQTRHKAGVFARQLPSLKNLKAWPKKCLVRMAFFFVRRGDNPALGIFHERAPQKLCVCLPKRKGIFLPPSAFIERKSKLISFHP